MTGSLGGLEYLVMPGLVMMAGGVILVFVRGAFRDALALAVPLAVLATIWLLPEGAGEPVRWLGYDLVPYRSDAVARLFGSAFALAAFAAGLFGLRQERRLETPVAYLHAGSAIGVAFAGDLLTLFVFWEAMAVSATVVVWLGGVKARAAGQRYVMVHLLGGVLLMSGIAGQVAASGSIAFEAMALGSPATWLILLGFLVNVAAWPLSAWLPDAYPAASWSGTVFLSAFTTKAAVIALVRGFPGTEALVWAGLAMIVYGTIYAAREGDMRRLVAYALVAQLGFMVAATGIGSDLAINGAVAHAVAGIFYQALLFMAASAVIVATGRSDCGDLGGLFRTMPVTAGCAVVGALSIAAFPLTSGYVAKTMVSDAVAAGGGAFAWLVVTAGSAAVVLHAGLRFPWTVFFARDSGARPPDPAPSMRLAMLLLAGLTIVAGILPSAWSGLLPNPGRANPYSAGHVVPQVQLLAFAVLGFMLVRRWAAPAAETITLDVDWLWRRLGPRLCHAAGDGASRAWRSVAGRLNRAWGALIRAVSRHHGPHGVLARSWPTGSMAIWAVFLLGAYLVLYYV